MFTVEGIEIFTGPTGDHAGRAIVSEPYEYLDQAQEFYNAVTEHSSGRWVLAIVSPSVTCGDYVVSGGGI